MAILRNVLLHLLDGLLAVVEPHVAKSRDVWCGIEFGDLFAVACIGQRIEAGAVEGGEDYNEVKFWILRYAVIVSKT